MPTAHETELNPFAPPAADLAVSAPGAPPDAEVVRRTHLNHEVSLQAIGSLWLLGGVLKVAVGMYRAVSGFPNPPDAFELGQLSANLIMQLGIGALLLYAGYRLRQLSPKVRGVATVASVLMLLVIPVGTLLGLYALYLMLSKKGALILSEEYAEIRRATPHIKYRSWIVMGAGILLLVAIVAMVAVRFFG